MNDRDCKHGQLARSCEVCGFEREIAELKAESNEWRRLYDDAMDDLKAARGRAAGGDIDQEEVRDLEGRLGRSETLREGLREQVELLASQVRHANKQVVDLIREAEGLRRQLGAFDGVKAELDDYKAMAATLADQDKARQELADKVKALEADLERERDRKHAAVDSFDKTIRFRVKDDTVTERKTLDLIDSGHVVVGYALGKSGRAAKLDAQIAFVVGGRVEWFGAEDWFNKMRDRGDQEREIVDLERNNNDLCHKLEELQEAHKETIKNILKESGTRYAALRVRVKELEAELVKLKTPPADMSVDLADGMARMSSGTYHKLWDDLGERSKDEGGAFVKGLGTVRACRDCGCLVAGGPTRCKRCAKDVHETGFRNIDEDSKGNKIELHDSAHGGLKHD